MVGEFYIILVVLFCVYLYGLESNKVKVFVIWLIFLGILFIEDLLLNYSIFGLLLN